MAKFLYSIGRSAYLHRLRFLAVWLVLLVAVGGTALAVAKPTSNSKLKLHGFNNLTKTLSFNIYDVCYAASEDQRQRYIEYIDEEYNADRLTQILTDVAEIIGANSAAATTLRGLEVLVHEVIAAIITAPSGIWPSEGSS